MQRGRNKEEHAYPADPEEGYGREKLYAEKLCQYYQEDGKMPTRMARFHNVYGPLGTHGGGRKKAPGLFFSWIGVDRFLRFGFREG